jgi:hypothetical protein
VWIGLDELRISLLMFFTPFLFMALVATFAHRWYYRSLAWSEVAQKPVLALVSEFLAYVVVFGLMVVLVEGKYRVPFARALSWNWPRRHWGALLAVGATLLVSLQGVAHFLPIPKNLPFDQFFERPLEAYLTSIFAISFGPLMEELFFRGFLYPVLARRLGVVFSVLLTGAGFGLLHATQLGFAWAPVLIIFLVGVALAVVRAATHSVGSSFLVHVGYNFTLTALTFVGTDAFRHMERLNQ